MPRAVSEPRGLSEIGKRTEARILTLLEHEVRRWSEVENELSLPLESLASLIHAGGKRLRPAFCFWAFVGAGGDPDDPLITDACAALELLHTFALVHDDIMDGSDRRRGLPAVHADFADRHTAKESRGEARRFGEGVGILVGDFAFVYSDMCMSGANAIARSVFDELRIELCVGQYLDIVGGAGAPVDRERAERISVFKSGKYTVERPLHLGAALADALPTYEAAFSSYGLPVGLAFQLRDDVLGVFGDATTTGKPVGDDLLEGKLTPLIVETVHRVQGAGTADERALLDGFLAGALTPATVPEMQALVVSCGALDAIETQIQTAVERARHALRDVPLARDAHEALEELAAFVAWRAN
ncbi:MAG: polyprenyl synthetase family protein [Acidimicrobiia bacterium]